MSLADDAWLHPVLAVEGLAGRLRDEIAARSFAADAVRAELKALVARLPPGSLAGRDDRRSSLGELGTPLPQSSLVPPQPEVGVVHAPVTRGADGGVLRLRVHRIEPGGGRRTFPPWMTRDAAAAARAAATAAETVLTSYRPAAPLDGWHRVCVAAGEIEPDADGLVAGDSLGAPLALALASSWADIPLASDVAVSGRVLEDGRLAPVGGVPVKAVALERERPYVRRLLVPTGCVPVDWRGALQIEEVPDLATAARALGLPDSISPRVLSDPELHDAVDEAERLGRNREVGPAVLIDRLYHLREAFERGGALERDRGHYVLCLARLVESHTHLGNGPRALELSDAIDSTLARPGALGWERGVARNVQASALIDAWRFAEAGERAREAVAVLRADGRRADESRALGTLGRVLAHARDDGEAAAALGEALALQESVIPFETSIVRCYLVGALARLGRFGEARRLLEQSREWNERAEMSVGWRASNATFLEYEETKLLVREGAWSRARQAAEKLAVRLAGHGPWPLLGAYRVIALAAAALGDLPAANSISAKAGNLTHGHPIFLWLAAQIDMAWAAATLRLDPRVEPSLFVPDVERIMGLPPLGDRPVNPFAFEAERIRGCLAALAASPGDRATRRALAGALDALVEREIY